MTRTVIALFDDFSTANDAVRDLVNNGYSRDDISMVANDAEGKYGQYLSSENKAQMDTSAASEGAGVGAGVGAVIGGIGGLLIGLGALAIPGIGPVIAAGPLAAALTGLAGAGVGAVAGGVTGGIIGALVDLGVPEESAQYYAEGVRRGGTLVSVRTADDMTNRAVDILNSHNPVDINKRSTQWRESGWTRFDPNAPAYSARNAAGTMAAGSNMATESRTGETFSGNRPDMYDTGQPGHMSTVDFSNYDTDFRHHFDTTMTGTGYTYEQYMPAYRYGYDLATNERYRNTDWNMIEPDARRYWDERNPGTWERFKEAVYHAWLEVKDAVR